MKRFKAPLAAPATAAALVALCGYANAAETATEDHNLEAVEVSALPLGSDADLTPASFDLLEGDLLFQQSEATLGDTLNGLPGVHADTFGAGSSRPVIRGQTAPRVSVLSDGARLFDMSEISPPPPAGKDHGASSGDGTANLRWCSPAASFYDAPLNSLLFLRVPP